MRNVVRWVEDYALASSGLDKGQVQHAAKIPIGEVERLFGAQLQEGGLKQLNALRTLGRDYDRMAPAVFQETLTVANFNYYFADALSRAFYKDYRYKVGDWMNYTTPDTAPDFRDVKRFRMTEPGTLYKRREKQQVAATKISDSQVAWGVDEFGRQFDVSWRTIINDDLGKIRKTPQRMANAAARWLDQFVSDLYDNATTQAALIALGALYAGTGRLTHANLALALNAMMQRTDADGNQMNIGRVNLVIPPVLRIQAATVIESVLASGTATNDKNVLPNFVLNVYEDPYIATAGLNVPWYLFADPNEITTVTVARLEGWPGPIVYQKRSDIQLLTGTAPAAFMMGDFATGNIEYAVDDIIGAWDDASFVGVTDFRGIYYSSGTTP